MKKLLIVAAIALSGCAAGPKNVDELKSNGFKQSFVVNHGYQQIYRNFKGNFAYCQSQSGLFQQPLAVDSEVYTDIGEGRITLSFVPNFGQPKLRRLIIIKQITDKQSELIFYQFEKSSIDKTESLYRRWAAGDTACE